MSQLLFSLPSEPLFAVAVEVVRVGQFVLERYDLGVNAVDGLLLGDVSLDTLLDLGEEEVGASHSVQRGYEVMDCSLEGVELLLDDLDLFLSVVGVIVFLKQGLDWEGRDTAEVLSMGFRMEFKLIQQLHHLPRVLFQQNIILL